MNMKANRIRKNVLKDIEASFLAQEAVEREQVTQRFCVTEDWDGAGAFWAA
jgi:hypothetical protein